MEIILKHAERNYRADLTKGISLASPLGLKNAEFRAWDVPPVNISPVKVGDWTGSVASGAAVNFFNVTLNPHGNGTHTEGRGHIAMAHHKLQLSSFHFICRFVRLSPDAAANGDRVVRLAELEQRWQPGAESALIIATGNYKPGYDFSGTNPPYFEPELLAYLRRAGIQHFLTDLPSVDREEDGGVLAAHRAFWPDNDHHSRSATITEMLAVPKSLTEGLYLLNLQVPALENDAAPSRPVIYPLKPE